MRAWMVVLWLVTLAPASHAQVRGPVGGGNGVGVGVGGGGGIGGVGTGLGTGGIGNTGLGTGGLDTTNTRPIQGVTVTDGPRGTSGSPGVTTGSHGTHEGGSSGTTSAKRKPKANRDVLDRIDRMVRSRLDGVTYQKSKR